MKQKEQILIEIRAAEGGIDSKFLVEDLAAIYYKSARNNNFSFEIREQRPGICIL